MSRATRALQIQQAVLAAFADWNLAIVALEENPNSETEAAHCAAMWAAYQEALAAANAILVVYGQAGCGQ